MDTASRYTYRVAWSDEDGEYVATVAEMPSLSWLAPSQTEALSGLCDLVRDVIAGKFQVRVPPELHRRLVIQAAEEHVSLNRLVTMKLS